MIEIISHRRTITSTSFFREYEYENEKGGVSFGCDKDGNVEITHPSTRENYQRCLEGYDERTGTRIIDKGVKSFTSSYVEPSIGRCTCGQKVVLAGFTNTCACGQEYNSSGQLLAPREQWGWDTGEYPIDIERIS